MKFYTFAERYGSQIYHRYIEIVNGKTYRHKEVVDYIPTIYIPSSTPDSDSPYRDFAGNALSAINNFTDMADANSYAKDLKSSMVEVFGQPRFHYAFLDENYAGGEGIEADIAAPEVFFLDIETECEFGFPAPDLAPEPVNAVTIYSRQKDEYLVLSTLQYTKHMDNVRYIHCKNEVELLTHVVSYFKECEPNIVTGWNVRFFDIPYLVNRISSVLGKKAAKELSPFNKLSRRSVEVMGREQETYEILGTVVLDYIELYKKFTYGMQESYKLDYIAEVELGENKIDYSEYGTSLHHLYRANTQRFIEYNIHDVTLVRKLDEKLTFIDLAMLIAYRAKVNYNDVFTQVAMWDALTVNYLKNVKGILSPFFPEAGSKDQQFAGAYVREPNRGLYDWVISVDYGSLYPSLIMGFNISPEKLLHKETPMDIDRFVVDEEYRTGYFKRCMDRGICIAANGASFKADKPGFLPEILDKMYSERKAQKKIMLQAKKMAERAKGFLEAATEDKETMYKDHMIAGLEVLNITDLETASKNQLEAVIKACKKLEVVYDARQMATKINLNSCFGVLGNPYFRWYDVRQAEAITLSGQLALKWISKRIDEYLEKIVGEKREYAIYGDTDSVYINLTPLVNKYWSHKTTDEIVESIDKLCQEKIEPFIDECNYDLERFLNVKEHRLIMKREAIGPAAFIQKKRYIMSVYDNEGVRYAEPKMKVMGLESVRSTTPKFFRTKINETFELLLKTRSESQVQAMIRDVKKEFENLEVKEFATPTGVRGISERAGNLNAKGTPAHCKAALVHNHLVQKMKLTGKYPLITDGEKIKWVYLKEPNPSGYHVVGFMGDDLPEEFGLHSFVDREKMYSGSYLNPIKRVIENFGWSDEERVNLMSFFDED